MRYNVSKLFLLLSLSFCLSSCGFKPIYKENAKVRKELALINVLSINSLFGIELHRHLLDILPPFVAPKYELTIHFNNSNSVSIIQKNSDIIQEEAKQEIKYILKQFVNKQILLEGKFSHSASYNSLMMPYSANVEKDGVFKSLSKQAAEEIYRRLILYFSKKDYDE